MKSVRDIADIAYPATKCALQVSNQTGGGEFESACYSRVLKGPI